jgi:hypothetical protein
MSIMNLQAGHVGKVPVLKAKVPLSEAKVLLSKAQVLGCPV